MVSIKLSTRTRYGLRVMFDLAKNCKGKPISLSVIAERQDLSLSYLEQIMLRLRKADLVVSVRGAYGGYKIARPAGEITVKEIFDVLEGPIVLSECVTDDECGKSEYCVTRLIYKKMLDQMNNVISDITLQDMIKDSERMNIRDIKVDI